MAAFNLASKMAAKLSFQSFLSSLTIPDNTVQVDKPELACNQV